MERSGRQYTDDDFLASLALGYKLSFRVILEEITVPQSMLMAEAMMRANNPDEQTNDDAEKVIPVTPGKLPEDVLKKIRAKINDR